MEENEIKEKELTNVSRKVFKVELPERDKEMAVFTHAKKLGEYIFVISEKAPKKFRWSIITRMQNCATEIVECLYFANGERDDKRTYFQKQAKVKLHILDFYTETAKKLQAINSHQMAVIAKQLVEVNKLLAGWIKSERNKK